MHRLSLLTLSLLVLAGCGLKAGDLGDLADSSGDASTAGPGSSGDAPGSSGGDEAATDGPATGGPDTEGLAPAHGVDVLFIIDNSGSMAAEQARVAAAIPALVGPLVTAGLDLRIAVTTTDSGNPRCPAAQYKPEAGTLQARSCRAGVAEGEWTFNGVDTSASCLDACAHDSVAISPTTTALDPVAKARPWIEWSGGAGNIDVPLAEALACVLPQGVAGCGFESPLESMYLALSRTADPQSPQFGFLRDDAHLLVVIVSDEMDCSFNPAFDSIFTTNKVFWDSPDDVAPTSAVCWRAGMACTGGPGTYDDCAASDHDDAGASTPDPAQAVLQPLARYQGALSTILADKLAAGFAAKVRLAGVVGVPIGYPDTPLVYADGDVETQLNFGIAPGCQAGDAIAVPPGRILELVEQVNAGGPSLFSICNDSFTSSMGAIAAGLL